MSLCWLSILLLLGGRAWPASAPLSIGPATVVVGRGKLSAGEETAARVLVEEVHKRTGLQWPISRQMPTSGAAIILGHVGSTLHFSTVARLKRQIPLKPESYLITTTRENALQVVVLGRDPRGVLFSVGKLLRTLKYLPGKVILPAPLPLSASPAKAIRGHQLGYRHTANSYDGWTSEQDEQYIRELAVFGANSVENIPFQDKDSPHMPIPRPEMNVRLSEICRRYEMDYWLWMPADFDLSDAARRQAELDRTGELFAQLPKLNGVFFPGGDPGHNPPELVVEYLEEVAQILRKKHKEAKVWLSLQGFTPAQENYVYAYIREKHPPWLGGLVGGPGSPPLPRLRASLPAAYGLRDYPDITHTVRCQYPVPWWDPAFNFTLGREPVNPRPYFYRDIARLTASYTDGFITYSDGCHDDLNKVIWNGLGWDPDADVQELVREYTNFFFGSAPAEEAADALIALENNWKGPLAPNGSVAATLALWEKLDRQHPQSRNNWRWQMHLLRGYYDAYTRYRLQYEESLEKQANSQLLTAPTAGWEKAIVGALTTLWKAETEPVKREWCARIEQLCEDLFQSVRLQTSVDKYGARGYERGAVLDFLNRPLNNRWWLEDELEKVRKLPGESEKTDRLTELATWENPGAGSYYDDIGNVAKSPHVIRKGSLDYDPLVEEGDAPGFDWWEDGKSRKRLSWQTNMGWPVGMRYQHLDPAGSYLIRATGYGECPLRVDGQRLQPTLYGKDTGELKEFPVPPELVKDGTLHLTWDKLDESHLNWRQQSRLTEVWLIKR
jgi:hypothetical protein